MIGLLGWTYIVLGTTMSSRAAATVEVSVGSSTRAGHTTLSVSADIDVGDGGGILARGSGSCTLRSKQQSAKVPCIRILGFAHWTHYSN